MTDKTVDVQKVVGQARWYVGQGRFAAALSVLKVIAVPATDLPELAYLRVMIAMEGRFWSEALELLDQLIAIEPTRAVLHLDRATCLIELGRDDDARKSLKADNPALSGRFPREVLLARIAVRAGDTAGATLHLRDAVTLDSQALQMAAGFPELTTLVAQPTP